jgi:CTP-dependent riboflavin kinase
MTMYPKVFRRAIGEFFPGTLNVQVDTHLNIREERRILGTEINEPGQDLLIERCAINGIPAHRIRPYNLETGCGGHGDNVLEIVCAQEIAGASPGAFVYVTFFRDDVGQ